MSFLRWIESKEVENAVLGVIGGGKELSPEERSHLMDRSTKEFSSEIINKIKGLGVVKKTDDGKGRYGTISQSISDGIKISSLIKMVSK